MSKEKINKVINSKYFIPCFVIVINIMFFVICNVLFELRYETLDDFTIMKIISKLDGTYSFYSVYIHPILSYMIMLLYKTGININWYTIVLLVIQFISFTTVGIIFLNKNKKIGTLFYILIISTIYSRLLLVINYTSIAAIAILVGIISLIYHFETNEKKYKIIGFILIIIGTMLRWKSAIISLPFFVLYVIYYTLKNKDYKLLKSLFIIILIILAIVISNGIIYKLNPIYEKYIKFNDIRTYFFDSNVMDYENNKEIFDKIGWTYSDWELFYTYSFADENFYNIDNLKILKQNVNDNLNTKIKKIEYTFELLLFITIQKQYLILFCGICLILLFSFVLNKNKKIILYYFLLHILINYVLCYTKPMYRVIVPLYATTFLMMLYMLVEKNRVEKEEKRNKYTNILLIYCTILYILINNVYIYKTSINYNRENFSTIKEIIDYTSSNKQNAYVYPNVLSNISLAYSVYEKIPDNTFSNLRHMGDWDIYNNEHYEFKGRYDIENIITDLYKKDNLYIISGNVYAANNKIYTNHIDILIEYIEKHYNVDVKYKVIREFSNSVKIYKIYEEK